MANRLLTLAEDWARKQDAAAIELWTDGRFTEAHGFYRARGYTQDGLRAKHDLSRTVEFRFWKSLLAATTPQSAPRRAGG